MNKPKDNIKIPTIPKMKLYAINPLPFAILLNNPPNEKAPKIAPDANKTIIDVLIKLYFSSFDLKIEYTPNTKYINPTTIKITKSVSASNPPSYV